MELMDHEIAIQMKACERYVLGELSAEERDEFEDHFSDCTRCMEDVSLASMFAANAKAVFGDRVRATPAPRPRWWERLFASPVPAFAALGFAAIVAYQNLVVFPDSKSPRGAIAAVVLEGETRSSLPQVKPGDALRVQMPFDHPRDLAVTRIFVELMDTLGNRLSSGAVAAPAANQPLDLYFPVKIHPGRYTVVLRADRNGHAAEEISRSSFEVTSQETKAQ